uniref:Helitron helicase-like domain-containing protein n=1 Tax=Lactuca sativa TaxID=4236 RepID=A0A9R1WRU9_LACSA|nr:hypothetical protein LSAT_V11C900482820 [Lactuca sativa]
MIWVAPHNPKLLMMFNCHINVEVCSSIKSAKYLFKYVYKGHDKQVIHIDKYQENIVINVIQNFQDARYVSPPEALWQVFSFPLSKIHPCLVRFKDGDIMEYIVDKEKGKNSVLATFFKKNNEDSNVRKYLYKDFPKHFTWNRSNHYWRTREHKSMIAEGERYYLRLLLFHITGPTYFEDLYIANGVLHPTFRKASLERGLTETDDNLSQCLVEASLFQFPIALRRLFATMLIFCEPGNVRKLWDDHYDSISNDYRKQYGCVERVQNMVLIDIRVFLESMSKKLSDYNLPNVSAHIDLQSRGYCEVHEEYSINVEYEDL